MAASPGAVSSKMRFYYSSEGFLTQLQHELCPDIHLLRAHFRNAWSGIPSMGLWYALLFVFTKACTVSICPKGPHLSSRLCFLI